MPIYDFRCSACDTEFQQLVRGETKVACPSCGARKLERLMSVTARPNGGGSAAPADLRPLGPPAGGGCGGGGCHMH